MKNYSLILTLLILVSCNNKTDKNNHSIIGIEFQNYKQIDKLADYIKISDTTIYENDLDPKYGILHVRNQKNNLIIFNHISRDSIENIRYKILDTLTIQDLNTSELITIAYCQINNHNDENLIAIVDKTDSLNIKNIKKVWRANTVSHKIETVTNLNGINCFNERFSKIVYNNQ